MNKIIEIGYIGSKRCYLNVDEQEAIIRYCESENINISDFDLDVNILEFDDEFKAYDIFG